MSEPFIGEMTMFGGNFAPRGWAFCNGQLLSIAANSALFSILGVTYGGDGISTFGLPDLRGRVPMHAGAGTGLTNRPLGSKGGDEAVTLTVAQMPAHGHTLGFSSPQPGSGTLGAVGVAPDPAQPDQTATSASTGGGQAHSNMSPFQCIQFIIALEGVYPSRN